MLYRRTASNDVSRLMTNLNTLKQGAAIRPECAINYCYRCKSKPVTEMATDVFLCRQILHVYRKLRIGLCMYPNLNINAHLGIFPSSKAYIPYKIILSVFHNRAANYEKCF